MLPMSLRTTSFRSSLDTKRMRSFTPRKVTWARNIHPISSSFKSPGLLADLWRSRRDSSAASQTKSTSARRLERRTFGSVSWIHHVKIGLSGTEKCNTRQSELHVCFSPQSRHALVHCTCPLSGFSSHRGKMLCCYNPSACLRLLWLHCASCQLGRIFLS